MTTPLISVIVPVLNDETSLTATLREWQSRRSEQIELVIVDGGSVDQSKTIAAPLADRVLSTTPGRAHQMNVGAGEATGNYLLFLHADTDVSASAFSALSHIAASHPGRWGFFHVRLNSGRAVFRLIETLMNWRARVTSVATGDQCLFVARNLFEREGGYKEIPLMEDVEVCKRLRKHGTPVIIKQRVSTSARRWEKHGVISTILLMWRLRLAYFMGASPKKLHQQYYG